MDCLFDFEDLRQSSFYFTQESATFYARVISSELTVLILTDNLQKKVGKIITHLISLSPDGNVPIIYFTAPDPLSVGQLRPPVGTAFIGHCFLSK